MELIAMGEIPEDVISTDEIDEIVFRSYVSIEKAYPQLDEVICLLGGVRTQGGQAQGNFLSKEFLYVGIECERLTIVWRIKNNAWYFSFLVNKNTQKPIFSVSYTVRIEYFNDYRKVMTNGIQDGDIDLMSEIPNFVPFDIILNITNDYTGDDYGYIKDLSNIIRRRIIKNE